ncbi:MAG: hypothetical protein V1874_03310 [Spirochaetota bacterium]
MKILKLLLFLIIILPVFKGALDAKPTIAFGYMYNIRNERELNYLEFIFPNSFANSVGANFDVNIKKPLELESELTAKNKSLKKNYEYYELPELINEIKSDIFIFGNFISAPDNKIKIVLNIYIKGRGEIFTFTNTGRMETQVTKIVDRISIIIINFMGQHNLYKVAKITPGTKLAVLTNLEGEEQNYVLAALMQKGYRISCFQNNEIHNIVDDFSIDKFSYITSMKNSYEIISDWRKSEFYHGTWTGEKYYNSINDIKDQYNKYDLNYETSKNNALDKISYAFNENIDTILIIGFSGNRKSSWVRAISMKEKELIWIQSNIKSDFLSFDPLAGNVNKIIEWMTAEPQDPFRKFEKPAGGK